MNFSFSSEILASISPDWLTLTRTFCWQSVVFFAFTVTGYFAAAGGLYWFYRLRRTSRFALSEAERTPTAIWRNIRNDVLLSVLSSGIFAVCSALMMGAFEQGHTRLYLESDRYGYGYIAFSLVLVILLQDAYFYFTHRLAHHPKCYKWLHQGHHHFKNPTPWTAFSFDPAEAMIQAIYLMAAVFIIPMHFTVLCAVVLVMTLGALIHHFGFRLFADSAFGQWLGSWMVGPLHHWTHHRKYTAHYSLYFTFWDKVMGTQQKGYEQMLDKIAARKGSGIIALENSKEMSSPQSATVVSLPLSIKIPVKKAS